MPRNSDEATGWDDDEANWLDLDDVLSRLELAEELFDPLDDQEPYELD